MNAHAIWVNPFGGPLSYVVVFAVFTAIYLITAWVRKRKGTKPQQSPARQVLAIALSMAFMIGALGVWEARYETPSASAATAAAPEPAAKPSTSEKCAESCPVKWSKRQAKRHGDGKLGLPKGKAPKPVRKAMNKWKANHSKIVAQKGWTDWWIGRAADAIPTVITTYCYGYWIVKGDDGDDCTAMNKAPGPATKLFTKVAIVCSGRAAIVFGSKGRTGLFGTGANQACVWGALASAHWN